MKETAEAFGNFKRRIRFVKIRHARLVQNNAVYIFTIDTDVL